MILKKTTRKTPSFRQLLYYIRSDKGRSSGYEHFFIAHNLCSFRPADIVREFEANDKFRTRSKITIYHEVLSFHPEEDRANLSLGVLRDIAQKYIDIRNPNALVFAMPHLADEHVHIHFMFSGNEFRSKKSLRMDNKEFARVRNSIEAYQIEKYPHLEKSTVYRGKTKPQRKIKDREYQAKRRLKAKGGKTQKEQYKQILKEIATQAQSLQSFFELIEQTELRLHKRKGRVCGVVSPGGKAYRFKTLGIGPEILKKIEKGQVKGSDFAKKARLIQKRNEVEGRNSR